MVFKITNRQAKALGYDSDYCLDSIPGRRSVAVKCLGGLNLTDAEVAFLVVDVDLLPTTGEHGQVAARLKRRLAKLCYDSGRTSDGDRLTASES